MNVDNLFVHCSFSKIVPNDVLHAVNGMNVGDKWNKASLQDCFESW